VTCPFCPPNNHRSKWYYDGDVYVVADDAGKPNALILFPHEHLAQSWLRERRAEVERLMMGIANAEWGRPVQPNFDWENRMYEHAHLQLFKKAQM
jgi:hypothetical protein